jgi:hypothetical protein
MGADSALLIRVRIANGDVISIRIPLEVCPLTSLDIDGDEVWMRVPASQDAIEELDWAGTCTRGNSTSRSTALTRAGPRLCPRS